ncbi:MAG: FAD-binding oxidoreductase [Anaerolineaceae bacterium]
MTNTYDVIIAGAGSVGTPTAFSLAKAGLKVLVLDPFASTGQGSNKHAIGGVRATHSDPAKILLCAKSINILGSWQDSYGDDIEWKAGGYSFVAYDHAIEKTLKDLLALQKSLGLNIDWRDTQGIVELVPDINTESLLGGTYSPEDGSASPMKTNFAFYSHAVRFGADFHFHEKVTAVHTQGGRIAHVDTNKGSYSVPVFINAAGSWSAAVSDLLGVSIPVKPDAHEAGITEAISPMIGPMIVDIRERPGSSNFYFYQHPTGKIIFCVTPNPQIWGQFDKDTSEFLPMGCRRLIEVVPKLANARIRRTWRGTYPMTPDGSPLLGKVDGVDGYILATGMCGQGFMLGPGLAELMTHLVTGTLSDQETQSLHALRFDRAFTSKEKLK